MGFCVASTRKGASRWNVLPPMVTCFSCMASSNADCTFAGARLISSASTMFAKIGPFFTENLPVDWSNTCVPTTSAGSKSRVNWIRLNVVWTVSASVRTVSVFARPGTPSIRTCPPVRSEMIRRSTIASWPTTRRATWARTPSISVWSIALCSSLVTSRLECGMPGADSTPRSTMLPLDARECLQERSLPRRKRARAAGGELGEFDRTESGSDEAQDVEPERVTQAADLAIECLTDRDRELPRAVADRARFGVLGSDDAVRELDAAPGCDDGSRPIPLHRCDVRALDFAPRMGQRVRRVTVAGEQEQPFGHVVQSADVGKARRVGDEIERRAASAWIALGGEDAGRLVEHQPLDTQRRRDALAVDCDFILLRVHRLSCARDGPINPHATRGHELLGLPP